MTKASEKAKITEAQLVNQLSAAGFSGAQIEAMRANFSPKVDVPKLGLSDVDEGDDEGAAKLANATKKRVNKVIGELRK